MARPTTKESLVTLSSENYSKLMELIESMSEEDQEAVFPFEDRDRTIRDVLCHLHEWHKLFLTWYEVGMSGEKPVMPKEGYTWKTTPDLNQYFWEECQNISLSESKQLVLDTHQKVMAIISSHTNEELFTKKYYKWTNTTSLGAYLVSATSSHYDWALKKIKKYKKRQDKKKA